MNTYLVGVNIEARTSGFGSVGSAVAAMQSLGIAAQSLGVRGGRYLQGFSFGLRGMSQAIGGATSRFAGMGVGAGVALASVAALTAGGLALGASATSAAIAWETAFTGVAKTVEATDAELDALNNSLLEVGAESFVGLESIARIAEIGGQQGLAAADIAPFTETVNQLVSATDLSEESAGRLLARFSQLSNLSDQGADGFQNFGAVITALGNTNATTEAQIAKFATRIVGTASAVGLGADEIAALAASLTAMGIPAERGGTAVERILNLMDQGGTQQMAEFGRLTGMTGESFRQLFESDPGAAVEAFFVGLGRAEANGENIANVMSNLGVSSVRLNNVMNTAAQNTGIFTRNFALANREFQNGGALQDEYQRRLDTTAAQFGVLQSRIEVIRVRLGQPINDNIIKPLLANLIDAAVAVDGFITGPWPRFLDAVGDFRAERLDGVERLVESIIALGNLEPFNAGFSFFDLLNPFSLFAAGLGQVSDRIRDSYEAIGDSSTINSFIDTINTFADSTAIVLDVFTDPFRSTEAGRQPLLGLNKELQESGFLNAVAAQERAIGSDRRFAQLASDVEELAVALALADAATPALDASIEQFEALAAAVSAADDAYQRFAGQDRNVLEAEISSRDAQAAVFGFFDQEGAAAGSDDALRTALDLLDAERQLLDARAAAGDLGENDVADAQALLRASAERLGVLEDLAPLIDEVGRDTVVDARLEVNTEAELANLRAELESESGRNRIRAELQVVQDFAAANGISLDEAADQLGLLEDFDGLSVDTIITAQGEGLGLLSNDPFSQQINLGINGEAAFAQIEAVQGQLDEFDRRRVRARLEVLDGATLSMSAALELARELNGFEATVTTRYEETGRRPTGVGGTATVRAYGGFAAQAFAEGGMTLNSAGDSANRHQPVFGNTSPGTARVFLEPETGGESYIPHANDGRRAGATRVLSRTANLFGFDLVPFARGGFVGSGLPQSVSNSVLSIAPGAVQVPINAAPGMDASEVARLAGQEVQMQLDRLVREMSR